MSKKNNKRRNRNNPFKCGGYSTAQSYKDKIAYKNNQIQLKMKAENIRNMLAKNDAHNETSLPIQPNDKSTLYVFSVGKEFPYNLDKLPVDFTLMDMLPDPTFVLSMSNIKAVELKQFEHDRPIEFSIDGKDANVFQEADKTYTADEVAKLVKAAVTAINVTSGEITDTYDAAAATYTAADTLAADTIGTSVDVTVKESGRVCRRGQPGAAD